MIQPKARAGVWALGAAALAAGAFWAGRASAGEAAASRVFELRTYKAAPGKLKELHARFRDHTNAIFQKHGMTAIGYWTPADAPDSEDTLVYILAHASRDAAKKSWAEFGADPDWKKAKADSEANGSLTVKVESKFLNPVDYSPLK